MVTLTGTTEGLVDGNEASPRRIDVGGGGRPRTQRSPFGGLIFLDPKEGIINATNALDVNPGMYDDPDDPPSEVTTRGTRLWRNADGDLHRVNAPAVMRGMNDDDDHGPEVFDEDGEPLGSMLGMVEFWVGGEQIIDPDDEHHQEAILDYLVKHGGRHTKAAGR